MLDKILTVMAFCKQLVFQVPDASEVDEVQ